MRAVLFVMIASACSYPQLPPVADGNADAPPVNPSLLSLDDAGPVLLYEGQGTGGSRPGILAITGQNFVAAATVRVFATGSETPMITVNNNDPMIASRVSAAGDVLAVSVTLPVDPTLPAGATQDIPLTIEVTQPAGGAMVTKALTGKLTLRTLPELTAVITDSASLQPIYSLVDVPGPLQFTPAPGRPRSLIRSASKIRLQTATASASGNAPGPGGAAGGGSGQAGGGGSSGGGAGSSMSGGGGGGLATAGQTGGSASTIPGGVPNGDPLISDYATNISAGGGGGNNSGGGGGGGTIELTAAGDVLVGAITTNGGAGGNGGITTGGGGGAGGIIVIRSGGTATLDTISALGGAAGIGSIGFAGAGSIGRTRIDASTISLAATATVNPPYHRGASWDPATPFTAKTSPLPMKLFGSAGDKFDVIVLDRGGGGSSPAFTADFGNATMLTVRPTLQPGFNRVCVTRNGGSVTVIEATNCIDVAYLP